MAAVIVGPCVGSTSRNGWIAGVRKSPLLLQPRPRRGLSFGSVRLLRHRSSSSVDPIEPAATMTRGAVSVAGVELAVRI